MTTRPSVLIMATFILAAATLFAVTVAPLVQTAALVVA